MPFDSDFLRSLERLARLAKRLARERPRRRRRAPPVRHAAGASGAVRDVRPYAPGDEVRSIDWAAYARLGRLLSRIYETEEPRDLCLIVDVSASMGLPARKLDFALRAAAAAAWLALARHDRVEVLAFADRAVAALEPRSGRGGAARVLGFLEGLAAAGPSDPRRPLADLAERRGGRRALAIVVSDALWPGDPAAPLAALEAGGLDPVLVHVLDPEDREPGLEGALDLRSAETGARLALDADASAFPAAFRDAFAAHVEAVEAACARTGTAYVAAPTGEPVERAMLEVLRCAF